MSAETSSFERLAREHGAMIRRIAASHEADPHRAEELAQEIYFAIWRALPAFKGASSLKTYVARIATNRAATHVAHAMKLIPSGELDEDIPATGESPESIAIERDGMTRLVAAVRTLPLTYRLPVTLTLEGFKPAEIAETLGITANAVTVRLSRAKELLRTSIGETP